MLLILSLACLTDQTLDSADYAPVVDLDGDGVIASLDCSDLNPDVGLPGLYYDDYDGDGYGAGPAFESCAPLAGSSVFGGDCDDDDPFVSPGESEIACNGVDEDCDGVIDAGMTVGTHQPDLESALAASTPGDVICLPEGTWAGGFEAGWVTLMGAGVGRTIIQGDGTGSVLTTTGDLSLVGVSLRGGAGYSAAVDVEPGSTLRLEGVELSEMTLSETQESHLLQLDGGTLEALTMEVHDISLSASVPLDGLFFDLQGGAQAVLQGITVFDVELESSVSAQGVLVRGADAQAWRLGDLRVEASRFESAGALSLVQLSDTPLGVFYVELMRSELVGGSVRVFDLVGVELEIERLGFYDTRVRSMGELVMLSGGEMEVDGLRFMALDLESDGPLCVLEVGAGQARLSEVAWLGDLLQAPTAPGLLLCAQEGAQLEIENALAAGNTAIVQEMGAWMYATQASVSLSQVDLAYNQMSGETAREYAVLGGEGASWSVLNSTVVGNVASAERAKKGADVYLELGQGSLLWAYSDVWKNTGMQQSFSADGVAFELLSIEEDPRYLDVSGSPLQWSLRLGGDSKLVDAGDPALLDRDGSRSDLGAFGGEGGGWWP